MNCLWLISLLCLTAFGIAAEEQSAPASEMERLEKNLENLRLKALNEEVEAQRLMRSNWEQYLQKIEAIEQDEKEIVELKKKIAALKKQQEPKAKPESN
jgi:hypothetical protein